jgi:hypothetical protein
MGVLVVPARCSRKPYSRFFQPLALVQPEILRFKVYEPVLVLGLDKFGTHTIRSG